MRIIHLIILVFFAALVLAVAQEDVGRVALVVFFTGLVEFVFGLVAIMTLFRTVADIGYADSLRAYLQALATTVVVLVVATATMNGILWLGLAVLQLVLPPL